VNEPGNRTVLADRDGDLWVRFDEWPAPHALHRTSWRHISTGTIWDEQARNKVGSVRDWEDIQDSRPLTVVDAERAAWARALVEEAWRRD
jgi:hypothetical protein